MSGVASPSLDDYLNKLLREEQQQLTRAHLEQKTTDSTTDDAYSAQGKPPPRVLSKVQVLQL